MTEAEEPTEPARIRDMPAPRRNPSAIGPTFRRIFVWPYRVLLAGCIRSGIRAWELTMLSLLTNIAVGVLIVQGAWLVPGLLLIPAGAFDVFDGGVARHRGEESRYGAFLDSAVDRVCDAIVFGSLTWSLAAHGERLQAGLALVTLVIALAISHLRAEAEAHGVTMSEGLFQRLERYVAVMVGLLFPGAMLPVLVVLVGMGGLTVAQRIWVAWSRLSPVAQKE